MQLARAGFLISVVAFGLLCVSAKKQEAGAASSAAAGGKARESVIEEVTSKQFERMLNDKDFIAVFWYARSCTTCDHVLHELEKIDDDTDSFGVDFVKINDKRLAKSYGIKTFPALTYFREKEPIIYDGDLMDEEGVLDFLTSLEAMDLPDRIEDVNSKILEKIVEDSDYVAVLFYKPQCKKCAKALQELENIDDEADQLGIGFVKISDEALAEEYNLGDLPKLVYYRHQIPIIYDQELTREEDVLEWLVQNKSTGDEEDVIEDVSSQTLETLIQSIDSLVVLFYDSEDEESEAAIEELEKIDDECDKHGIQFVKIDDAEAASEYGIEDLPAIVYFDKQEPNVYEGDLENEEEILEWLISHEEKDEIEDITDEVLDRLIKDGKTMAVLFYDNNDKKSQKVLDELENIDDECDALGISFVKIDDVDEAKEYGVEKLPALMYFENGIPTLYEGNCGEEEKVLKWLEKQQKNDEIEDVTGEVLDMLIEKMSHVAVLFYDKDQKKSQKVLSELENIDDECDQNHIAFVKIDNAAEAKEYGIDNLPTLVLFEKRIPHIFEGDLTKEDELLSWLVHQKRHSEIPEVTDEIIDKLIETVPYLAVVFYDKKDKEDVRVLNELENIDDDLDKEDIVMVRLDNKAEAKTYGIDHLPTLVYFENKIPALYEGELMNEEEVLQWLIDQKNAATIEEVTDEMLKELIAENEYVVVYFSGRCEEGESCDDILEELENIDDELDENGIIFVTTEDTAMAKKYGIKKFPTLILFRNKEPVPYTGDIEDEDEVLTWLTDEDTLEIPGQIEEVNAKMLEKILDENDHVVVFFYEEGDKKSQKIIAELENIDDECEESDIDFVKTSDDGIETEYDLDSLPALIFYRNKIRKPYTGDLMNEEAILKWVLDLHSSEPDIIESVDRKTLQTLIKSSEHLAVFFYDDDCTNCDTILLELETIDDDTDKHGITFVKSKDVKLASEIGIFSFPTLVYYDTGVPIMYDGDLLNEKQVLEWVVKLKTDESIEEIDREELFHLIETKFFLAVVFYIEDDPEVLPILRHVELIDDQAAEFGIKIVKCSDRLMAKKFGFRDPPGITYFRKGKPINYDGDIDDEEELVDWLTDPSNMELTEHIERVNKNMFKKIRQTSDYLAAFFYSDECKQCGRVLTEIEHIDDEAEQSGIDFVKIDDPTLAKEFGVFALPAILFFKISSKEPVIYAGDLYDESEILQWLLTQKDPSGDVIEELEGEALFKTIKKSDSLAVYFYSLEECAQCKEIVEELENIDDDCDRHGITFVKTQDVSVAEYYGVSDFPSLVYFEAQIPNVFEGDLTVEEEVLQWLITQKIEDRIELITRQMLESMVEEFHYLAVYFYKMNCNICEEILDQLENIDDECDVFGIHMVKIMDPQLAKRYSIKTFPALVYFRNGNPLLFEGDLQNEESVVEWLIDDENRELADEIEQVNSRMLERLLDDSPYLAVFFYDEDCIDCDEIVEALEAIDDEADQYGINMVKITEEESHVKYNIINTPSLVYFRKREPLLYDGDLTDEAKLLTWLTSQDVFELSSEIEEVNRKMVDKLLEENEYLSVYFYEEEDPESARVLEMLEKIDGETEHIDISIVKMSDTRYARKWGVIKLPSLVFFRNRFPSIYRGDFREEENVLDWLKKNRFRQPELNLFMYALIAITTTFIAYTAFLMYGFPTLRSQQAS